MLAAGRPGAPPLVFLHGAGTFHGWAFAEPWTERFRVLIPHHPGYGESGRPRRAPRHPRPRAPLHRAVRPARADRGRQPRRLLARRPDRRPVRDRAEAPAAAPGARRAGRAAGARRRGRRLVPHPARGAAGPAGAPDGHAPAAPARPIPHDVDFTVDRYREIRTTAIMLWEHPFDRVLPRWLGGSTSRRSWCGARRTACCRRPRRGLGRAAAPMPRWRRSRTPGTSCSTSRPRRARPWPGSATAAADPGPSRGGPGSDDVRGAAAGHRLRDHRRHVARRSTPTSRPPGPVARPCARRARGRSRWTAHVAGAITADRYWDRVARTTGASTADGPVPGARRGRAGRAVRSGRRRPHARRPRGRAPRRRALERRLHLHRPGLLRRPAGVRRARRVRRRHGHRRAQTGARGLPRRGRGPGRRRRRRSCSSTTPPSASTAPARVGMAAILVDPFDRTPAFDQARALLGLAA